MTREFIARLEKAEQEAWSDVYAAAPGGLRQRFGLRAESIGAAFLLLLERVDHSDFNRVLGLGVHEPVTESAVDRMLEVYRSAGIHHFLVHLTPNAQPPEVREWLSARGLVRKRAWAKVWRPAGTAPQITTDLRIFETNASHAMRAAQAVCAGFTMPETLAPWMAALVGRPHWRHFSAWDGDAAVAGGSLFLDGKTAWLGIASTRTSHRNRGAQGALMARRIQAAIAAGCDLIVTEGAEELPEKPNPSYHNMVRAGFRPAYLRENWGPGS